MKVLKRNLTDLPLPIDEDVVVETETGVNPDWLDDTPIEPVVEEALPVALSGIDVYSSDGIVQDTLVTQTSQSTNNSSTNNSIDEEKKGSSDRDKLVGSGIYLNHKYALVDEDVTLGVLPTNAGKYKISIFLSPKFRMNSDIFTKEQNVFLKYNDVVQEINLVDDIDSIGLKGYIELKNPGSHLDIFLERHNNYYVIINFTKYSDNILGTNRITETPVMKFEPYIFDIDYVENLSNPETEQKSLRIWLVDIVTSILRTHSIASVIKQYRNITTRQSYKEVLNDIMLYVKNYIKINTNNKYLYHKPLMYTHTMKCNGVAKNGNDEGASMTNLVKATFKKIKKNASIKEALNVILTDCCTTLKTPATFDERYMTIGDVLIPFFFKEEYPDPYFVYSGCWVDNYEIKKGEEHPYMDRESETSDSTNPYQVDPRVSSLILNDDDVAEEAELTAPVTTSDNPVTTQNADSPTPVEAATGRRWDTDYGNDTSNLINKLKIWNEYANRNVNNNTIKLYDTAYGGKANVLVNRQMTMRDIFMPFYVAFGTDKYYGVYEDINPAKDPSTEDVVPILGVYQGDLKSFQFNPINMNAVSRLWKNMIFLDCSSGATAMNSTLIFFSWFFDYYQEVFLNGMIKPLCSNVMPDFFMVSRMENIKHANDADNTFENKFDEYNSYTYATHTGDSLKECLRVMGKNLASFTLINDSYIFRIHGNLFRRPNEIIKLGYRGNRLGEGIQMVSYQTGMTFRDATYLYVRKVTHIFRGDTYDNVIEGCKICEILGDIALTKQLLQTDR